MGVGGNLLVVELPEPTERTDFSTIADIGRERIRRAAKAIQDDKIGELNLSHGRATDLGFKAPKFDRSNFKVWQAGARSEGDLGQQI